MIIKVIGPDFDGYAVTVNGEIIMECLSEDEVNSLTIGEIKQLISTAF